MEYERFQRHNGAVAALVCESRVKVAGLVTDISMSGLSFRYLDLKISNREEPECPSCELKISWNAKKEFYINRVPCKIVSDHPMAVKEFFSYVPMNRCSVSFGEMNPDQISQLKYFIENLNKGQIDKSPIISLSKNTMNIKREYEVLDETQA